LPIHRSRSRDAFTRIVASLRSAPHASQRS